MLMIYHYPDLGSTFDQLKQISYTVRAIRSTLNYMTLQIWVVSRQQYGISAVAPQMSFRERKPDNSHREISAVFPPKELVIDYFACWIGPAPEAVTNEIFARTGKITSYKLCKEITVDLDTIGSTSWEVEGHTFTVTVRDSVEDYTQLMKEIFDFDLLKKLISGVGDQPPFKFVANAMNGGGWYLFNGELQILRQGRP